MGRLKIDEVTREDGSLAPVFLGVDEDGDLVFESEDALVALPPETLASVLARYGAPYAPEGRANEVAALELGAGARLRHVRHLAFHDVIAKDWLVFERDGDEPCCALAVTVAGALAHLARAAR